MPESNPDPPASARTKYGEATLPLTHLYAKVNYIDRGRDEGSVARSSALPARSCEMLMRGFRFRQFRPKAIH
jgi:hypothetical protein